MKLKMKNDEIEDENELILDLSIGGIFSKPARESHVVRRRKREVEKLKKSVGLGSCGSVNGPFVENKVWLDSEIVKNGVVLDNQPARKKEKIGNGSLPVFLQEKCRIYKSCDGNVELKSDEDELAGGGRRNPMVNSHSSGGGGFSSAHSDGQCSSHQGGATDDSRSNYQPATTSTASEPSQDPDQPTGSSKQTASTTKLADSSASEPNPVKPNAKPNPHDSISSRQQQQQASFLARMPCVSTTGNGPNGKTVSGFLYRYTKNEVSIVCVCHGQSFSPAGFVEHAGGVDIAHPLKHITIFPTAFAS